MKIKKILLMLIMLLALCACDTKNEELELPKTKNSK